MYNFTIMSNENMANSNQKLVHWADQTAEKIIRERGDLDLYTCASGITPSGTVHIGNFREIISVDLVVRALRSRGKNVRFIYSWDDYDVFRKVPKNMPKSKELENYFIEFRNYMNDCEFRSCTHIKEVNCGIKKAVQKRKIDKGRYERYVQLYEKLKGEKKW